jgi:N-acetylmuramoyl-L-alanine amidase
MSKNMSAREEKPEKKEKPRVLGTFSEEKPIKERMPTPPQNLTWQTLRMVLAGAAILATLFTIWTPANLFSSSLQQRLAEALAQSSAADQTQMALGLLPEGFPVNKIGIVVGHRGNDSGAVCASGLTEVEVNSTIASFVQKKLTDLGYEVELLDEFDPRLVGYQAVLLLSIHADSCDYYSDSATGFKIAAALSETKADNATRLVACMADRYHQITGLQYNYHTVTVDMTSYHAFTEIDPLTTAAIIETGFLNLDQEILTKKPELIADGIVAGIQCYLNNEGISSTPTPETEP